MVVWSVTKGPMTGASVFHSIGEEAHSGWSILRSLILLIWGLELDSRILSKYALDHWVLWNLPGYGMAEWERLFFDWPAVNQRWAGLARMDDRLGQCG